MEDIVVRLSKDHKTAVKMWREGSHDVPAFITKISDLEQELRLKCCTLDSIFAKNKRLWQWARETLNGEIADQFWQIVANGHLMLENPEYIQRIKVLEYRATTAEAEVAALREAWDAIQDLTQNSDAKIRDLMSGPMACNSEQADCIISNAISESKKIFALSSTAGKALLAERDALREALEKAEIFFDSVDVENGAAWDFLDALAKAKEARHD